MNAWLFGAERVIFPSADTKFRFTRYFPDISEKAVIAWHPDYEKMLHILMSGKLTRVIGN